MRQHDLSESRFICMYVEAEAVNNDVESIKAVSFITDQWTNCDQSKKQYTETLLICFVSCDKKEINDARLAKLVKPEQITRLSFLYMYDSYGETFNVYAWSSPCWGK